MFRQPSGGVKKPGFCGHTLEPPCNTTLQHVALSTAGRNVCSRAIFGNGPTARSQQFRELLRTSIECPTDRAPSAAGARCPAADHAFACIWSEVSAIRERFGFSGFANRS
jgi:hypothetical protein